MSSHRTYLIDSSFYDGPVEDERVFDRDDFDERLADHELCGEGCRAVPRKHSCGDGFCGAWDCKRCYGPGLDHSACE